MTTLAGTKIKDTYRKILQVPDATTGFTGSLQYIQDGDGTNSPIQVSTTAVSIDSLTATSTFTCTTIVVSGLVDGRDIATDGAKLDNIEANADVTDNTNVLAALVGSEATIANQANALPTSAVTTGTFADARISESSVTQHEAALSVTESQISDLGTYAEAATVMTFTNKTFDANGTGNSLSNVDVADLANGTDGELITWDASGNPATVSVGTSGQVLTSNGAGAAPTFQASGVTAGNRVLLETLTASNSATLDFENLLDSTYDRYEVEILKLIPATDGAEIRARVGTGATPTWVTTTSYRYSSTAASYILLSSTLASLADVSSASNECYHQVINIFNPSDTSVYTYLEGRGVFHDASSGNVGFASSGGAYEATTAVTSFRVYCSAGNITSGQVKLYGIKK